jgi:hypothetical protein
MMLRTGIPLQKKMTPAKEKRLSSQKRRKFEILEQL